MAPTPLPAHTYNFDFSSAYTPHVPSPLSSSPLRPSSTPSPLQNRDMNASSKPMPNTWKSNNNNYNNDNDARMSSPTPSPSKPQPSPFSHPRTRSSSLPSPPPSRGKESVFSKRIAKPNPLLHAAGKSIGEKAETRRKLFLQKVRGAAEEKRWTARGGDEEVMRVLWEREERERRVRERVLADGSGFGDVDVEEEESLDEIMAEEVAVAEQAEVEALVGDWVREREFGSDEEDWDEVFLEMLSQEGKKQQEGQMQGQEHAHADQQVQQQGQGHQEDHDMMDMS
ncbi:hypothetical protein LHYA1_G004129 [Lachnellula hyalina]|uniref:Uncharacterized protein n=1 Tax=Lachnellula hyalina TaxID=1316788 RepID=A0A8H8R1F2_9HELO|nr:uncharacterized protein LHYA1_G004129 [Lachnellula hyalina]TVY26688.1 hypothetical protein LHYA1_G004129 [Lachnellula hyalina]